MSSSKNRNDKNNTRQNDPDEELIPELGDIVTFESDLYKITTGKIVYRDGETIRIHEYNGNTKTVEFNLDPNTGMFLDNFGVSNIIIHKKRKDPHFSVQLGTIAGEELELYNAEGELIGDPKQYIVAKIVATEEDDIIVLENGERLDFGFIGPPDGVNLVIPHSTEEDDAAGANDEYSEPVIAEDDEDVPIFPGFDANMLPAALVEEIPTTEVVFSDTIQRTDMFATLFADVPISKQRDPKTLAALYRTSDLLLAMKNSVVFREDNGAIMPGKIRSYAVNTIEDIIQKQPAGYPVGAVIPVVDVKKTVYLAVEPNTNIEEKGVTIKSDVKLLIDMINTINSYNDSAKAGGNPYISYVNNIFNLTEPFTSDSNDKTIFDQDVLRSGMPAENVYGLTRGNIDVVDGASSSLNIANVKDRYVRILSANIIKNHKTGITYTVAEANSAKTIGHVVLDKSLSAVRSPIRSSVLLWDILASDTSRRFQNDTFYNKLDSTISSQIILNDLKGRTAIIPELQKRLESDTVLSIATQKMISVMDTLGLRNLEITPEILTAITAILRRGQNKWMRVYELLKQSAKTNMEAESVYPVAATTENSDLFSDEILSDPTLQLIISAIQTKEKLFGKYDLVYANDILKFAGATMGPLWYLLGSNNTAAIEVARQTTLSEIAREERINNVRRELAAEFTASPIINPCEHVMELERLRSISSDEKRMLIFEKFVKKYQAGQRGNYIICGSCNENLVCKHEMLLLNEFLHPGRGSALHKALLLEYGDGVFEGAYICKSCGQKIKDIEYDTHMEFDDDGRPLVGRAVIEEEKDETDIAVVIEEEVDAAVPFKDKVDKAIYKLARVLFERIGLHATDEMYRRVVSAAKQFIEQRVIAEEPYNEFRQREEVAVAAGKRGIRVRPEYKKYFADLQVGIIGALVLIEFQTSDIEIPVPMGGIPYSRDGFPVDGLNPKVVGTAALAYVTFGLAGIFLDVSPWNETSWSGIGVANTRLNLARNALLSALFTLLAIQQNEKQPVPPLTDVTDQYKQRMHRYKHYKDTKKTGESDAIIASKADHLPTIFRPLAFAESVTDTTKAISNISQFKKNVETGDLAEVAPVVIKRSHRLMQQVMAQFHKNAAETAIIIPNNPRSDSVCCYSRLAVVETRGVGIGALNMDKSAKEELQAHTDAVKQIKARDPAINTGGTHLYVPWSAPYLTAVLPTPSPDDYYKLFIKNCFRGRKYGLPHELDPNNVCRNCRFAYPVELLYPLGVDLPSDMAPKQRQKVLEDMIKEREAIAKASLEKEININDETFRALEAQIKAKHEIIAPIPLVSPDFLNNMEELGKGQYIFMPESLSAWNVLIDGLKEIQSNTTIKTNDSRMLALSKFAGLYDKLLGLVEKRVIELTTKEFKNYIKQGFEGLSVLTENPVGAIAPRNIVQALVIEPEMIANGFVNVDPPATKWFPSISLSHKELLRKIWDNSSAVVTRAVNETLRWDGKKRDAIKTVLKRFSSWMSNWTTVWINEMRPGLDVTERELTLMLRWVVLTGIDSLLNPSSYLYNDITGPELKTELIKFINRWLLDTLVTAAERSKIYQLTQAQIDEALAVRAEKEKAYFIKKFDDLDQDQRQIELIKKNLKLGDWAKGTVKNLFSYDADFFEYERDQRAAFGVPEFGAEVTGIAAAAGASEGYGFDASGPVILDVENDNMHYAKDGDEQ